MAGATDSLLEAVLRLPENERARIAKELIASLDDDHDPEVELAWAAEVERRRRAVARGEEELVPWERVREEALNALKRP